MNNWATVNRVQPRPKQFPQLRSETYGRNRKDRPIRGGYEV